MPQRPYVSLLSVGFIDRGDYRAAQEARAQAEEAADLAGDDSILSLYDSQDLKAKKVSGLFFRASAWSEG
jgi:hypothetical protein